MKNEFTPSVTLGIIFGYIWVFVLLYGLCISVDWYTTNWGVVLTNNIWYSVAAIAVTCVLLVILGSFEKSGKECQEASGTENRSTALDKAGTTDGVADSDIGKALRECIECAESDLAWFSVKKSKFDFEKLTGRAHPKQEYHVLCMYWNGDEKAYNSYRDWCYSCYSSAELELKFLKSIINTAESNLNYASIPTDSQLGVVVKESLAQAKDGLVHFSREVDRFAYQERAGELHPNYHELGWSFCGDKSAYDNYLKWCRSCYASVTCELSTLKSVIATAEINVKQEKSANN